MNALKGVAATVAIFAFSGAAFGAGLGQPEPWQLNLQEAASPIMERIASLHDALIWLITIISLFVLVLLAWVAIKFNAKANPTPSKTTHHTMLEVA